MTAYWFQIQAARKHERPMVFRWPVRLGENTYAIFQETFLSGPFIRPMTPFERELRDRGPETIPRRTL